MHVVQECYRQASYYENHGDLIGASRYYKKVYEQVKEEERAARFLDCERVAAFFYRQGQYEEALLFTKLSVQNGSDKALELYVACCAEGASEGDILWARPYVLQHPFISNIHTYFSHLVKYADIYEDVYEAFELVEEAFRENSAAHANVYILFLQMLTELEIKEDNLPQARYYIRRWMLLDSTYVSHINELLPYAIYLDDLPVFWKRKDTLFLLKELQEDVHLFYSIAKQLHDEGNVQADLYEQFASYECSNPLLAWKKQSYIDFVQALQKKAVLTLDSPSDWMGMKALLFAYGAQALPLFRRTFRRYADIEEAVRYYRAYTKPKTTNRSLEHVSVTVVGGGDAIGGSCLVVTIGSSHIMIDAGMLLQPESGELDFTVLKEQGIELEQIDALLITHAHMDHIGNVPSVFKRHPSMPMYATKETKALMRLMLKEQEKYSTDRDGTIDRCLYSIQERGDQFCVPGQNGDWSVTWYRSGHIVGAVSILLEKDGTKVFVTGDYSVEDQRTVQGLRIPDGVHADIVVTESTYAFWPTSAAISRRRQEDLFVHQLSRVIERGGSMLIPAFALGRAQEVVALIRERFPRLSFHVYLDGMVSEVTRLYEKLLHGTPLLGHGVQIAKYGAIGFDSFVDNFVSPGNSCVIASSGMLYEGTKSMEYAKHLIHDERHALTFTGYMDEESPGFAVSQAKSTVLVNGKKESVRASLLSLRLSAHASREDIVQTVLALQPRHVILVHGDAKAVYEAPHVVGQAYPTAADLLLQAGIPVIHSENGTVYTFKEE